MVGFLTRDHTASRGDAIAIDIKPGHHERDTVVVTREELLSSGVAVAESERTRVYLARLARSQHGWRVIAWDPQQ